MTTGDTIDHNRITRNFARALESRLKEGQFEVFTSRIRILSSSTEAMYPDVVVAPGALPGKSTELEMPIVAVEVLPEATAAPGRGVNRWGYQAISSLQHYVLIDQDTPILEVASRADDGSWRSIVHRGLKARLRLEALGVEFGLDEIFARVTFASGRGDRPSGPESQVQA